MKIKKLEAITGITMMFVGYIFGELANENRASVTKKSLNKNRNNYLAEY
jgi:hypothetical protein